jgi:hypothetical protein
LRASTLSISATNRSFLHPEGLSASSTALTTSDVTDTSVFDHKCQKDPDPGSDECVFDHKCRKDPDPRSDGCVFDQRCRKDPDPGSEGCVFDQRCRDGPEVDEWKALETGESTPTGRLAASDRDWQQAAIGGADQISPESGEA